MTVDANERKRNKLTEEAKVFNAKIDKFIEACENGIIDVPSNYNLLRFLDVDSNRLRHYKENMDTQGYRSGFDKLTMYREDYWTRKSLEAKTATSAIFHLKQPMNGGYMDKQEKSNEPIEIKVTIAGCDNAFK